ncbi:MAG TPA: AMP-binding protein [Woeseiaceae bacterium]|nr:AMP-binding protein [Woeseiaceae bacterium]
MQKPWLSSYPEGVPENIANPPFTSLTNMIESCLVKYSERIAYSNMGTSITFGQLDQMSYSFACYLQNNLNLKKGDRVAIMLPNILQYPIALCGILRAGLVVVNVNPLYTARELKHQLTDSGAKSIVILENFADVLSEIIDDTDIEKVILTKIGDMLPFPKKHLVNFVLKYIKKLIPKYSLKEIIPFIGAVDKSEKYSLNRIKIDAEDLAFLQYTGGTTGLSKGAMISHKNMLFNLHQSKAWQANLFDDVETIVAITALPLYHIFSLQSNCLAMMLDGGENVLITNPRDFPAFVKELSKHKFVYITGVNTLFASLLNTPGFDKLDFTSLRWSIGGGMAVQSAVSKDWEEITGQSILQAYGLTETSPAAIVNPINSDQFTGSIGLPISSTEVIICDDDGNSLPIGELGEICIRGPQVMQGYWGQPEETKKVMLPDNWLKTGDIGRMDDKGFVYIEDRKKDMILVSGFNVYPNEIESVVVEMKEILEAAAIGKPSSESGESVKLFVVKKDPKVTEEEIYKHCKKNLTAYKVPKEIEFRDELPKTNVGKILRRALREE